ncbi:Lsr2 family DNA-binding protein [Frankia sp. CiP1_Cm_nod2]|uniref:Lsr2 family DNA-binding protein n=1 Tax=Frankia sp. CiP1_Cm_nod2 TaxID=2897161 RepID=UPI0040443C56
MARQREAADTGSPRSAHATSTPARTAGSPARPPRAVAAAPVLPPDHDPAQIRSWARANGRHIGDRGRIPSDVIDAFRQAHATP